MAWRRCRASRGAWLGGEEEGIEVELPGASVRRGGGGGREGARRWRRLRSVRAGEREQRREGRGGRVSETVSGIGTACGNRPRVQGLVGKQEVAARPCACEHAATSGRGEEDDGGLQWWAGPASAGPPGGWASGKRRVSFALFIFFSLFCFVFI